ncbi:MAG TPA: DNA-formamidopyrimidine glycosylase family protein [Cytophagaceae bacterium]|jgi:formamidopyrimidine-DNA glycosylase
MPELPELVLAERYFNKYCFGKKIKSVEVKDTKILKQTSEKELNDLLVGQTFQKAQQYGKYLLVTVDKSTLLAIHFGMTGKLLYTENVKEKPASTHCIFEFADGSFMFYSDRRKIGRISFAADKDDLIAKSDLGPDALHVSKKSFLEMIANNKRGRIKPVLMDQSNIAGIGNVYADEILFQSYIHPEKPIGTLSDKDLTAIFKNIEKVLTKSIDLNADRDNLPKTWLTSSREKGLDCPRKNGVIEMKTVGGRSTYFCASCQEL